VADEPICKEAHLIQLDKDLRHVNMVANLSSGVCRYCDSVNDPEDAGREFARFGYFILGERGGVSEPFHLLCAKMALSAWVEFQKLDLMKRLEAADKVISTLVLQTACTHDAEPDFCDGCKYEREKRTAEALVEWRKTVEEPEVPETPPS
jgi:hypothetical protein